MHRGLDAAPIGARCLEVLLDHFADREHQHAQVVVRTDEERVPGAALAQALLRVGHRRHGQVAAHGVAGYEVAHAGAVVGEQALAVRRTRHDLGRVGRMVGNEHPLAVLLPPAEGGYEAVVAVQDAGLTGGCLRRQQCRPFVELHLAGADPLGEERHATGTDLVGEDGLGEAVDLDDHHARFIADDAIGPVARQARHQLGVVRRLAVGVQDGRQDGVEQREHDRPEEGRDQSGQSGSPAAASRSAKKARTWKSSVRR